MNATIARYIKRATIARVVTALCFATSASVVTASSSMCSLDGSSWRISPASAVTEPGETISTTDYLPTNWTPAQVPGTVFGSYVLDKLEPEPTYADNVYKTDFKKYDQDYWYRTTFSCPFQSSGRTVWLNFDGVNRDADIYLNGQEIGVLHGFMQRGRFDITPQLRPGTNVIAALVHLPKLDAPNHSENYASPTFICSKGWDWMPRVPGLNMGIYKDVYLTTTGAASLIDPWIRTEKLQHGEADLSLQTTLENSTASTVPAVISGDIEPGHRLFTKTVLLPPSSGTEVDYSSDSTAALRVINPRLWWPNGYGAPNLYHLHLTVKVGPTISDTKDIAFGIRQYSYDTNNETLHFYVNGVRVFPKGGSWGMADFMLRCTPQDYDIKVRFHKEMNFNMIRNWMGMTPDSAFYDACDRYGIMVWDEFWLNSSGDLPESIDVFNDNVIEKIKTFRNHPSIALWCGENEGAPPAPLNDNIRAAILKYDGGDRYYQPNSHSGNLSGSGPWGLQDLKSYFTGVHGGWGGNGNLYGTRSEIGMATFPSYDSLEKFLPKANQWPQNGMWNQHFFVGTANNSDPRGYVAKIYHEFGPSQNAQEFAEKAQAVNLEGMKAMYEGWLDHSDTDSSAIIIWMSQSAYPSLVWQTYDYYYDTTGSYWGAKSACEPIHIYWNEATDAVRVVNTSGRPSNGLTATAQIYNLDGSLQYHRAAIIASTPTTVASCFQLTYPDSLSAVQLIRLSLKDRQGNVVSENSYWRGTHYLQFQALDSLPNVVLFSSMRTTYSGETATARVLISNPPSNKAIAFMVRPKLIDVRTKLQILPVIQSDCYFTMLPGETQQVVFQYDRKLAVGKQVGLKTECWNNIVKAPLVIKNSDLALEKPITASSNDGYAMTADAVVDGDPDTRWSSAWSADPQWLVIDLGKSYPIGRVKLSWEDAYAKSYSIQLSDDQQNWTTIYHTDNGPGGLEDLKGLTGSGRYIRLYMTTRATQWGYSLWEMEVYKTGEN